MKLRSHKWLAFVAVFSGVNLVGCLGASDIPQFSSSLQLGEGCSGPSQCGAGLECEYERGVATCRPHRSAGSGGAPQAVLGARCASSRDCGPGLECEFEHGLAWCQPHRGATSGSSGDGGVSSGDGGVTGSGVTGAACASSADCAGGLECEFEHGTATCQPHGGDRTRGASDGGADASSEASAPTGGGCRTDADCPAGMECEYEHGVTFCQPHGSSSSDGGASSDGGSDASSGTGPLGAACASDADCGPDLECEFEHGTATCQPHGRGGRD